jgi:hypothetical protein
VDAALRFVQHDKRGVTPSACEESIVWMLCFAQHDKSGVIPSESEESSVEGWVGAARNPVWMLHCAYAPFSMTRWCHSERSFLSFRARARNPVWMLHCAYASFSMTSAVSFRTLFFCHSERSEESIVWMLRFAQHDKLGSWIPHFADASVSMTSAVSFRALFFVIPSESEESSMDASLRLRSVQHDKVVSFRTLFFVIPSAVRNPVHGCFASLSMTKATVSFRARARNP